MQTLMNSRMGSFTSKPMIRTCFGQKRETKAGRCNSKHPGGSNMNLVKNEFPSARLRQTTAVAKPWFWLKGECQTRGLYWQTLVKQL